MVIEQQCENCSKKGKNVYCNNCIKVAEYFEVFKYNIDNNNSRFGKGGQPTDRIKAYTWHDAIEYVKYNYFEKKSKENLNINCEKDFAYLEEADNNNENLFGYSIYIYTISICSQNSLIGLILFECGSFDFFSFYPIL